MLKDPLDLDPQSRDPDEEPESAPHERFSWIWNTDFYCTGCWEPGSRCHPNECIFGCEKPRGVGILELGVYGQGEGNGEFSLQATGDHGGRILSQLGGFPSK